jgi:hypothetical protein
MSMENHGRMLSKGEDSFFHQSFLAILPAVSSSNKAGGTGEGNDKFGLSKYLCSYYAGFLNMPHTLTTWSRRLYFASEERCAEDFYRLKNPSPSAGFEPTNLGSNGRNDTITPPRTTSPYISKWNLKFSVFCDVLPCSQIDLEIEIIPEDSELHTRRRENLKSHISKWVYR